MAEFVAAGISAIPAPRADGEEEVPRLLGLHRGTLPRIIDMAHYTSPEDGHVYLVTSSWTWAGMDIWDATTREIALSFPYDPLCVGNVKAVACYSCPIGPDIPPQPRFCTGSGSACLTIYDGISYGCLHKATTHENRHVYIEALLAFTEATSDRPLLASGSNVGGITLWDGRDGSIIHTLATPDAIRVTALCSYSNQDGQRLAVGDDTGRLRAFDVATGDVVMDFVPHTAMIRQIITVPRPTHRPDRPCLVVVSLDGAVTGWAGELWSVESVFEHRPGAEGEGEGLVVLAYREHESGRDRIVTGYGRPPDQGEERGGRLMVCDLETGAVGAALSEDKEVLLLAGWYSAAAGGRFRLVSSSPTGSLKVRP
jgi:WD40 repeat protein